MNLNEWFGLKYEIIYFYNVYGPHQIYKSDMAAVIGMFEENFKKGKPLPVVKPGSQSRKFTHVQDTVDTCIYAWKKIKMLIILSQIIILFYNSISKTFSNKIKMIPKEEERDLIHL